MNDTELLTISFLLAGGYGYILNEINVNIVVDVADDWDNRGHLRLSQTSPANTDFDYRVPLDFLSFSQNGLTTGVRATKINGALPRTPIIPRSSGQTNSMHFTNLQAAVGAAGTVDALISFWEYDLEQMVYFPAHSALNVVPR